MREGESSKPRSKKRRPSRRRFLSLDSAKKRTLGMKGGPEKRPKLETPAAVRTVSFRQPSRRWRRTDAPRRQRRVDARLIIEPSPIAIADGVAPLERRRALTPHTPIADRARAERAQARLLARRRAAPPRASSRDWLPLRSAPRRLRSRASCRNSTTTSPRRQRPFI